MICRVGVRAERDFSRAQRRPIRSRCHGSAERKPGSCVVCRELPLSVKNAPYLEGFGARLRRLTCRRFKSGLIRLTILTASRVGWYLKGAHRVPCTRDPPVSRCDRTEAVTPGIDASLRKHDASLGVVHPSLGWKFLQTVQLTFYTYIISVFFFFLIENRGCFSNGFVGFINHRPSDLLVHFYLFIRTRKCDIWYTATSNQQKLLFWQCARRVILNSISGQCSFRLPPCEHCTVVL
jgi:hypothetical protein